MDDAPLGTPDHPLRVAVIGAGPSGFYAAEHLQEQPELHVQVDMYDRLPTPFGLVRGGVAPDHQKIKSVTRVYDRIATHPEFRFYGNVELGRDLTHEDLVAYYHAVIYAVGARTDRRMGVPREHLPGSHSATEFVGWYNAHPDFRSLSFDLSAEQVAVVGNGNVAMDLARILASPPEALAATDIAEHALEALAGSKIRVIHVLGRRGPAQAAFTNKELRELGEIPGVDVIVRPEDLELDPLTAEQLARVPDKACERNLETLRAFAARPVGDAPKRIELHFLASPQEILGAERVEGLRVSANELYASEDGGLRARVCGEIGTLPVGLVFRAIGYQGVPLAGVPFDPVAAVIPNQAGRIVDPASGAPVAGEYVVGWIKRGPRGIIGTNKPDAQETARALLEDLAAGRLAKAEVPGRHVLERLLAERRQDLVSYEDWQLIDLLERERGAERGDRPRLKFSRVEEMLAALAERKRAGAEAGEGGSA
ncbi:MAG: ferredoxin/flavodoxin---NADP+ reductase [Miltoncostaeaceae bacterium]|jgi:ferredoxin--NADP+ reductase|nr:ferredoxin/flavodoxin---NADP+ reductase [Miltoncostaeaceae bacterium]